MSSMKNVFLQLNGKFCFHLPCFLHRSPYFNVYIHIEFCKAISFVFSVSSNPEKLGSLEIEDRLICPHFGQFSMSQFPDPHSRQCSVVCCYKGKINLMATKISTSVAKLLLQKPAPFASNIIVTPVISAWQWRVYCKLL